jgi:hypothetical protein
LVFLEDSASVPFADDHHATDDVLERYSTGRLADPQRAEFEEHLLVCEYCQARLAREDDFTQGMRDAAALLERPPKAASRWTFSKPAWAFGLAALGLIAVAAIQWPSLRHPPAQGPALVLLHTTRGAESAVVAMAGRPLILVLDLTDLQPSPKYKLEIVDSAGRPALQSEAVPRNDKLEASIAKGLPAGAYFVRIYTFAHELLREYALTVHG